ncbi:MAG: ribosomal-processing cysteine protease Prp [Oscillospiraceae bacterium]|nr:ribosomal-processing cysteine protease Prp [Oscillospiraceae bacterium]
MITASFGKDRKRFVSCKISGHAGYADYGEDIVCASVTSAVQYTANAMTEVFGVAADVSAEDDLIALAVPWEEENGSRLLEALHLHLTLLSEEYPKTISIKISEV